ncbi:MAG: zinc ribbon domain-containing protein [Gemmatimonadales bacterium]
MPTYEYECPSGHRFEKFQKMTDKPRAKCPTCGKAATRKISGGAGLVFKGTGFYITDYGKDGKGPRKAETEKPAAESKTETPKADAKPAAKGESKSEGKPAKPASSRREGKAASE